MGYLRTIQPEDLYSVTDTAVSTKALTERFENILEKYREKAREKARQEGVTGDYDIDSAPLPKNALLRALNETFFYQWWSAGIFKVISDSAMATLPLVTKRLIAFTMAREYEPVGKGVGYALGIVGEFIVFSLFLNHFFYRAMLTGAQVRAVLSHSIYKKSLRLSSKARITYTNGKLTNLLSTDCHRVDFALQWMHFVWAFPVSIAICLVVILTSIGVSGLVGFALLFISLIVVGASSRKIGLMRVKVNVMTDKRVSIMREILQSMKVIKFYSWEEAYRKRIMSIRAKEMSRVRSMLTIRNLLNAVFVSAPTIASLISYIVYSKIGHDLNPADVFSSLSTFNIIRMPLMLLPLGIVTMTEAYLALGRIEKLLSAPEEEVYVNYTNEPSDPAAITITNGQFVWEQGEPEKDVKSDKKARKMEKKKAKEQKKKEKEEKKREKALSREITHEHASNAQATSQPIVEPINSHEAIPNDVDEGDKQEEDEDANTEEILTESDRNQRESSADSAVQFTGFRNLNLQFTKGEFVIITGSIGSGKSSLLSAIAGMMKNLEGSVQVNGELALCGQQWIQNATVKDNITFGKPYDEKWYNDVITACSLTRDFEILPGGDLTEVGERGITLSGGQKARICLARSVYWNADIILLDDVLSAVDAHVGQHIVENCILTLLKGKTRLLATHQLSMLPYADRVVFLDSQGNAHSGSIEELRANVPEFDHLMTFKADDASEEQEADELKVVDEEEREKEEEIIAELEKKKTEVEKEKGKKKGTGLMQEEDRATDSVDPKVYLQFFKHGGGYLSYGMIPILFMMIVFTVFCQLFTNTWLSFWTQQKFEGRTEGFYIGIFVMFGVLTAAFSFIFFFLLTYIGNTTSFKLHILAVNRILHAPMTFFDTSPLGRVLNRFTKDTDTMDNELSDQARLFLLSSSSVIGVFILIIIYLPWFAIALAGLLIIFVAASSFYRASAREIKRLDALGRSVVFSHFSETLTGIPTIKSYNAQERFVLKNERAIDRMDSAYFLTIVNQRWLALRLDCVGASLTLVVTMLCVTGQFNIEASSVGLVLSSLLQVVGMLSLTVRELATVENNMNSVERVYHYAYNIDQEAAFKIEATRPGPSWPEQGQIEFKDTVMSYQPHLPPVLKGINASIKGGEKIGICGRTGAGKSSIMVALYRLAELSGGSIEIDGVDISTLGLNDLRSKLSIIPQDPVLFQGTVRSNVDPFNESTDVELWDALRRAWLVDSKEADRIKDKAESSNKFHLDSAVDDDGTNFSLGERQLLALARALVRNSKILILDEATSSVDFETDHKIQTTIVREFVNCTILCIAHRLRTILNYDRIIVMDSGEIIEFDTPRALFDRSDSVFRSMCDQSGITVTDFDPKQ